MIVGKNTRLSAALYLLPEPRERLTVPVLSFSKIEEMNAGMYRGEKVTRGKKQDAGNHPALGGAIPASALQTIEGITK